MFSFNVYFTPERPYISDHLTPGPYSIILSIIFLTIAGSSRDIITLFSYSEMLPTSYLGCMECVYCFWLVGKVGWLIVLLRFNYGWYG